MPQEPKRLNKYLSNAGICSRREADKLIEQGLVTVNGSVVKEMGFMVQPSDVVVYDGKELKGEKFVYFLLNKPKDFISTLEDDKGRRTVMELMKNACSERIVPVGRLDRNTTGLLLFTNDGELANALAHPSGKVRKLYEVTLDRDLTEEDFLKIRNTIKLDDGPAPVDDVALSVNGDHIVGMEIHIGRNRIVRRIFEHLGYEIKKLDRTVYAGLTKKDLPRGKWRQLGDKEVLFLKRLANIKTEKPKQEPKERSASKSKGKPKPRRR